MSNESLLDKLKNAEQLRIAASGSHAHPVNRATDTAAYHTARADLVKSFYRAAQVYVRTIRGPARVTAPHLQRYFYGEVHHGMAGTIAYDVLYQLMIDGYLRYLDGAYVKI